MAFMAILLVAGAWRDAMRRLRLYAARWTRPVPLLRFRRTVAAHPANRVWAPAPPAPWSHRSRAAGRSRARAHRCLPTPRPAPPGAGALRAAPGAGRPTPARREIGGAHV